MVMKDEQAASGLPQHPTLGPGLGGADGPTCPAWEMAHVRHPCTRGGCRGHPELNTDTKDPAAPRAWQPSPAHRGDARHAGAARGASWGLAVLGPGRVGVQLRSLLQAAGPGCPGEGPRKVTSNFPQRSQAGQGLNCHHVKVPGNLRPNPSLGLGATKSQSHRRDGCARTRNSDASQPRQRIPSEEAATRAPQAPAPSPRLLSKTARPTRARRPSLSLAKTSQNRHHRSVTSLHSHQPLVWP